VEIPILLFHKANLLIAMEREYLQKNSQFPQMNNTIKELSEKAFVEGIYKKNIHYIYRPNADPEEFRMVKTLGGSPGMASWIIQQAYRKVGSQMHVSKEVSDDLQATDFSSASKIENVPWIAPVVEVYFEDPLLPTILVMKSHPTYLQEWFPQLEVNLESTEYISALMQEGSDELKAKMLSIQLKPSMYEAFLSEAEVPDMQHGFFSSALSQLDNSVMCYMLQLVLKVFAFSSIPAYKPVSITRKQMNKGGKPDVKGRPLRPAFRTAYLPKIISPSIHSDTNASREFHGRRGHIRWYNNERFVNKKGTWDFIQPVIDPATGKYPIRTLFKVRKP